MMRFLRATGKTQAAANGSLLAATLERKDQAADPIYRAKEIKRVER